MTTQSPEPEEYYDYDESDDECPQCFGEGGWNSCLGAMNSEDKT